MNLRFDIFVLSAFAGFFWKQPHFITHLVDKSSHVTRQTLKCYDIFGLLHHDTTGLWLAQVSGFYLNTLQSKNVAVSQVVQKKTFEKNALEVSYKKD